MEAATGIKPIQSLGKKWLEWSACAELTTRIRARVLNPFVALRTKVSVVLARINSAFQAFFAHGIIDESVELLSIDHQNVFLVIFEYRCHTVQVQIFA